MPEPVRGGLARFRREDHVAALRSGDQFDILIVGGGATGLGAAVDAATRGHRVALIEAADFAQGTSSRSTKLVHGGVRYLQQGNVSLVLEALRERGRLARNAPHLVRDLPFVIPNYEWWEGPFYGIGMKVYDGLAGKLGLAPSRWLNREQTRARIPTIEMTGLNGGVIYHDGQFDDARLAIHLARTAADYGGVLANHCHCLGLIKEQGEVCGAEVRDEEDGHEFTIRAQVVINATGVFADQLRRVDDASAPELVTVSQGIHLVLPKRFLPGDAAIMVPKTRDGRVLFAVPWHDRVVVGTTDTARNVPELEPRALAEERDFVMSHAQEYLDDDPTDSDVLSVFAGLRPLVKSGEGHATAALSRDHQILVSESGLITVTGGKWTTYRKMAEDVIDHAEMVGALPDRTCVTVNLPVHGSPPGGRDAEAIDVYGTDRLQIQDMESVGEDKRSSLTSVVNLTPAEVTWHVRHEMACRVEDVLSRRHRALLLDARGSRATAAPVAELMARELGHDREWVQREISSYHELSRRYDYTDPESRVT